MDGAQYKLLIIIIIIILKPGAHSCRASRDKLDPHNFLVYRDRNVYGVFVFRNR